MVSFPCGKLQQRNKTKNMYFYPNPCFQFSIFIHFLHKTSFSWKSKYPIQNPGVFNQQKICSICIVRIMLLSPPSGLCSSHNLPLLCRVLERTFDSYVLRTTWSMFNMPLHPPIASDANHRWADSFKAITNQVSCTYLKNPCVPLRAFSPMPCKQPHYSSIWKQKSTTDGKNF